MSTFRRLLESAVVVLVLAACASLPPVKLVEPGDLNRLSGEWKGTWSEGSWSGPITLTIHADEALGEFVFDTPTGGARSVSRIAIEDGKLILHGDAGHTTLTLHERDTRRALIGEYRYSTGQTGTVEVWRR
jgi:hypothetical protein